MSERLHFHFSLSCIGEGNGNPLQCSCLENPRDGEAWWAAVYGIAQSDTTEATAAAAAWLQKVLIAKYQSIIWMNHSASVPFYLIFHLLSFYWSLKTVIFLYKCSYSLLCVCVSLWSLFLNCQREIVKTGAINIFKSSNKDLQNLNF